MTVLWINAVCIDQENVQERNQQVQRMHQIYEKADVEVIWLGEAVKESDIAMDFITELGRPELTAFEEVDGEFKPKWSARLVRCWAAVYSYSCVLALLNPDAECTDKRDKDLWALVFS
jgi:hypothetical protein